MAVSDVYGLALSRKPGQAKPYTSLVAVAVELAMIIAIDMAKMFNPCYLGGFRRLQMNDLGVSGWLRVPGLNTGRRDSPILGNFFRWNMRFHAILMTIYSLKQILTLLRCLIGTEGVHG